MGLMVGGEVGVPGDFASNLRIVQGKTRREATTALRPVRWSNKPVASMAGMAQVRSQMRRIAAGKDPAPRVRPVVALAADQLVQRRALRTYSQWLGSRRILQEAGK